MKKYCLPLFALLIAFCFVGCSNENSQTKQSNEKTSTVQSTNDSTEEKNVEDKKETKKDFSDLSEKGKGTFYLSTSGGTSENGNIPVIYSKNSNSLIQIGCNTRGFDGTKISFIYVDGVLNSKDQLADTQTSINISKSQLEIGTHKVDVVQYDNNDEAGNVITYKTASYEVKSLN